jgi:RNA polymerase sigma-70 factor (ECF subfamily)
MGQAGFVRTLPAPIGERVATTVTARQNEFEQVAMPHSRSLLRVARRLASDSATAEDLVQETLLRAWSSFHQFQPGTNARAWLFRILFNAFYAQGRKIRSAPVLGPLQPPSLEAEPESRAALSVLDAAVVSRALDELSAEHRSVLLLAVVEGFTCREMAEILSLPIGTVMSRLSRARAALRTRLEPAPPKASPAQADAACAEKEAL